jgi:hypothetical protein
LFAEDSYAAVCSLGAADSREHDIRRPFGGALVALLSLSGQAMANGPAAPNDPFILQLQGIYSPVVKGPDLGLSVGGSPVNLSNGIASTVGARAGA